MKKIISLLIALCLSFQIFILPANAYTYVDWADRADNFTDTVEVYDDDSIFLENGEDFSNESGEESKLSDAYKTLLAIGVVKGDINDTPASAKGITRAVFVQMVMRGLNYSPASYTGTMFADVESSHFAYDDIGAAIDMGIVSGSNGYFRPNDIISYNEAVTVLVNALGGGIEAKANGGYPVGYALVGGRTGILDGVNPSDMSAEASNEDLYSMLLNTLRSDDYAEMVGLENEDIIYRTGRSILEVCHKIYLAEGIIDTVGFSSILPGSKGDRDSVKLGSLILEGRYEDYIDFLGMHCEVLYKEVNNEKSIIDVTITTDNKIVVMNAGDVSYENGEYIYDDGDKERKAKLADGAAILYNGSIVHNNIYVPEMGYITLINNDASSGFDVVRIDGIEDIIVGSVDSEEGIIYDLKDSTINLDADVEDSNKIVSLVNLTNVDIYPSMVTKNNILSVKKSYDGSIVYGIVSDKRISGTIEAVSEGGGDVMVTINGAEYRVTNRCLEYCRHIITAGRDITLYMNGINQVAYAVDGIVGEASGMQYAYCIDIMKENGLSDKVLIKLLNADGTITADELAKVCKIDAKSCKTSDQKLSAVTDGMKIEYEDNSEVDYRVIRISRTEDGTINEIDTVHVSNAEDEKSSLTTVYNEKQFEADENVSDLLVSYEKGKGIVHKGDTTSGSFGEAIYWDMSRTVIFEILNGAPSESEKYRVNRRSSPWANDNYYKPEVYRSSDSYWADAIVTTSTYNATELDVSSEDMYVVTKIVSLFVNDEDVKGLYVTKDGANEKLITVAPDKLAMRDISEGDIIIFDLVDDTKVNGASIAKLYDYEDDLKYTNRDAEAKKIFDDWFMGTIRHDACYVYDVKDGLAAFYVTDDLNSMANLKDEEFVGNGLMLVHQMDSAKLVKVKSVRGKITVTAGTVNDLMPYVSCQNNASRIFFNIKYVNQLKQVFIIEHE